MSDKLYPLDQKILARQINIAPKGEEPMMATFYFKHPSLIGDAGSVENARENKLRVRTYRGDKMRGKQTFSNKIEGDEANAYFFDKTFEKVVSKFYFVGEEPTEEVTLKSDQIIEIDYQSDPDLADEFPPRTDEDGKPVPYTTKDLIPLGHKATAVDSLLSCQVRVIPAPFRLGASRKWIVEQFGSTLGGHVIRHIFREPQKKHRNMYQNEAFNSYGVEGVSEQNRETVPIRVTNMNLNVFVKIYKDLIVRVEGASVGGKPVDIADPEQIKWILSNWQSNTIISLFEAIEGDSGNS